MEVPEVRILCVTTKLCTGGVQSFLINYARILKTYNVFFDYIVQTKEEQVYDKEVLNMGGKIYRVTPISDSIWEYIRGVRGILKEHPEYKNIHIHLNYLSIYPLLAAYLEKIPSRIVHSHSNYEASSVLVSIARFFIRLFFSFAATTRMSCSLAAAEWLYGKQSVRRGKIRIINNAIDIERFSFSLEVRNKIRKQLLISDDTVVLIHVGSFSPVKNHSFILSLFKEYHCRNKKSKLILCGDGNLRSEIERNIKKEGLEKDVFLLGNVSDVEKYLCAADVFVFPSFFEGLALSAIEAQSTGLCCVISNTINDEVVVCSKNVVCLPLNVELWINQIFMFQKELFHLEDRYSAKFEVANSGYSIVNQCKYLMKIYQK